MVGIRTPMEVDAAYEGMEIQILNRVLLYKDHGLREYQQHGSVCDHSCQTSEVPALGE